MSRKSDHNELPPLPGLSAEDIRLLRETPGLLAMILERLEQKGLIVDSGRRRNGKIVYVGPAQAITPSLPF
jgi:hypothetical protein